MNGGVKRCPCRAWGYVLGCAVLPMCLVLLLAFLRWGQGGSAQAGRASTEGEGYTRLDVTCLDLGDDVLIMKGGLYGLQSEDGSILVEPKYTTFEGFSEGLARISYQGRWGFISREGEEVIPPVYEGARDFASGLAAVKLGGKWGYVDSQGQMFIEPQFQEARDFLSDWTAVCLEGRWGYIDRQGGWVVPPKYDAADEVYSEGLMAVKQAGKWGYLDTLGRVCIPLRYEEVDACAYNVYKLRLGTKWGLCNGKGVMLLPHEYERIDLVHYGVICLVRQGKQGLFDPQRSRLLLEPLYDDIRIPQREGLYTVQRDSLYGFVDTLGRELIAPQYQEVSPFGQDGYASVLRGNEWICIDKQGKQIKEYGVRKLQKRFYRL